MFEYVPLIGLNSANLQKTQKYLNDYIISDAPQWGWIDADRWNAFYNWINEKGLSEAEIPENTGFTNDYLN